MKRQGIRSHVAQLKQKASLPSSSTVNSMSCYTVSNAVRDNNNNKQVCFGQRLGIEFVGYHQLRSNWWLLLTMQLQSYDHVIFTNHMIRTENICERMLWLTCQHQQGKGQSKIQCAACLLLCLSYYHAQNFNKVTQCYIENKCECLLFW